MSAPTLTPRQQTSVIVLPATGTLGTGTDGAGTLTHYPFGVYADVNSDLFDKNFEKRSNTTGITRFNFI